MITVLRGRDGSPWFLRNTPRTLSVHPLLLFQGSLTPLWMGALGVMAALMVALLQLSNPTVKAKAA